MKVREIVQYELGYQFRSASTWMYAGLLFLIAFGMFMATADGRGEVLADAPERLAWGFVRAGMFGLLVTAALFGDAAVRDVRAEMDPLVFTSPVRTLEYLGGRFLGALVVNGVVLAVIPFGIFAATLRLASFDPDAVGAFRAAAYLQPFFLFLLPNLVLAGAILFTIGALARHTVPIYLSAIGLFIGYIVVLNYANQIESPLLATLVDPLGLVTLERLTQYWTPVERNARLVGVPETLLLNRLFWLATATAALVLLHRTFRFAHVDGGRWRLKRRTLVSAPGAERARHVEVPRVAGSFGIRTTLRQTLAVARNSLAEVAASRWFAVALIACVGLTLLWGWNVGETVFDTSTWPVTLLVAETVLSQRATPLFIVLIAVFAGELVWKEREVGAAEVNDAVPLPNGAALVGRFLALVAMIVMFQAASMLGGLLIQALQGYFNFEIGLYLRIVFGLELADYVLYGALAMSVHVLVNQKHLGHMLVLAAFGFTRIAEPLLGIDHHLLLYGTDPGWTYSDMNGFGPFVGPFAWFKLYWAAWAMLLAVLAVLFRTRGYELGLGHRVREARARLRGPSAGVAAGGVGLALAVGGFIFYNTNILNGSRSVLPDTGSPDRVRVERGPAQADYEKRYKRFEGLPQPTIERAQLRVEIHPDDPAVDLRGTYHLVNRTAQIIDSVHVYVDPGIDTRSISVDQPAEPTLVDEAAGYRIYTLERPLAPGDAMALAFDVAFRPLGFPNEGIQTDVVANGSYFNRTWMPFVGYQPAFELIDEETRAQYGLGPRPPMPTADAAPALTHRWGPTDADLVQLEAVIGTAADQIAITPGVLRRSWTEGGRRYFHYVTEGPTPFGGTIVSARYAVVEDQWQDVALRIFHHPAHDDNLDRMVRGMKASLDYLTGQFGRYPASQLRIVEIPRYGGFGIAHPHTIAFTEDVFFSRVGEGEVDQAFYGTAHETAHTWWGGMVRGAPVRGAAFLSESLANYSAMMVTEQTYGPEAGRRMFGFQMERYLRGRAEQSREVPVLEVEDQPYIAYRKGAVALYILRDYIGEQAVNSALRRYYERYRGAGPPYPTALDLYAELQAVTPDSLRYLLTDLFETVTLWDLRTERAVAEPTASGEYTVTIDIAAMKVRADGVGNETEVPMDDLIEISVFPPGEDPLLRDPLYRQRHRIRSGEQTITVTVSQQPGRAGIDSGRLLIDLDADDNTSPVVIATQ